MKCIWILAKWGEMLSAVRRIIMNERLNCIVVWLRDQIQCPSTNKSPPKRKNEESSEREKKLLSYWGQWGSSEKKITFCGRIWVEKKWRIAIWLNSCTKFIYFTRNLFQPVRQIKSSSNFHFSQDYRLWLRSSWKSTSFGR